MPDGVRHQRFSLRPVRRLLLYLAAGVTALLPAGCTVPAGALAGVGVDRDGNLLGYLHVCRDHIDGATLYYDTGSTELAASTTDAGAWKASAPITETATWSLSRPNNGWTTLAPLQELPPDREYTLYGWSTDNSWSAGGVTFTVAEVARLKPGQILHWSGRSGGRPERDLNEVSSLADFEARACQLTPTPRQPPPRTSATSSPTSSSQSDGRSVDSEPPPAPRDR